VSRCSIDTDTDTDTDIDPDTDTDTDTDTDRCTDTETDTDTDTDIDLSIGLVDLISHDLGTYKIPDDWVFPGQSLRIQAQENARAKAEDYARAISGLNGIMDKVRLDLKTRWAVLSLQTNLSPCGRLQRQPAWSLVRMPLTQARENQGEGNVFSADN